MCKHGSMFTEDTCTICSGAYDANIAKEKKRRDDNIDARNMVREARLGHARFMSNAEAKHMDELWEESDYETLYDQMNGFPDGRGAGFRVKAYEVGKLLGRSYLSIKYHHKYMFLDINPVKRREWWYREMREGKMSYEDWDNRNYPTPPEEPGAGVRK